MNIVRNLIGIPLAGIGIIGVILGLAAASTNFLVGGAFFLIVGLSICIFLKRVS